MRQWVDRQIERLGGLVLPPRCVLCGGRGQRPCLDLCPGCEASLPPAGGPVPGSPGALRRVYVPFSYAAPLDHLVHSLKYRGHLATGRVLGTLLADRVEVLGMHRDVDVIVPVPLHSARLAERGFNQSAELAGRVGRNLRLPVVESLAVRRRATRPQVGLHLDERRSNLAGAFAATPAARGLRIALLDDVTTTGRTLQELAAVLLEAGAEAVDGWCVARADRSDASYISVQTPHDRMPKAR